MDTTKRSTSTRTRAMTRQALADITPVAESGATDTSSDTMSVGEPDIMEPLQSWDSLCVSKHCPIKHPHNFGLRPQILPAAVTVWQDADTIITDDDPGDYPDTQPPPLIKAMIDTLQIDPLIIMRYSRFTDILRDFYRAHGGRSDKYHGPAGMFGLGVELDKGNRDGSIPYHRHPDEERMGGWFAFEIGEDEENEDSAVNDCE